MSIPLLVLSVGGLRRRNRSSVARLTRRLVVVKGRVVVIVPKAYFCTYDVQQLSLLPAHEQLLTMVRLGFFRTMPVVV